jgi:hypothetical protein
MLDVRKQIITGVVSPDQAEAMIREVWPSLAAWPGIARLARLLTRSIIGAPLAWIILLPLFALSIAPFLAKRYTLTNRRLMIRRFPQPRVVQEVPLGAIDEVRVQTDDNSDFFRAGTLHIISQGKPAITLSAVPEPESFRQAIINACKAWVPGKANGPFIPAKAP